MDAKEKNLVEELYRRITSRTFHERDVLAMLILLREHSPGGSPVHELADFIAHRKKDRGWLKKYVQHVVDYGEALVNGSAAQLNIDAIYSPSEFYESLNVVLGSFSLPPLRADISDDVSSTEREKLASLVLLVSPVTCGCGAW